MPEPEVTTPLAGGQPAQPASVKPPAPEISAVPETGDNTLLGKDPDATPAPAKPGDKPADAKPTDGQPGGKDGKDVGQVPETYKFQVPEGMTVDQKMVDAFTPVFKELGLTQEKVDKLTSAYVPHVSSIVEAQKKQAVDDYKATVKGWHDETMKALGPEAEKEMAHAAKFITKFSANKEEAGNLRALFNETGLGSHPLIVKLLITAGKQLAQDGLTDVTHGRHGAGENSDEAVADKLYTTMK